MREFGVDANVGAPQVAYRETVRGSRRSRGASSVRPAAAASSATCIPATRASPGPAAGYLFESKIVGGAIPREYIPAVDQGVREALEGGVLAGYPIVDVHVELVDGSYHEVDSSRLYKIAGSMVLSEAAKRASPALLEPVMAVVKWSCRRTSPGLSSATSPRDAGGSAEWRRAGRDD